jgi:hypothetical protein
MRPETRSFDSRRQRTLLCCLLTTAALGAWLALPPSAGAGPARYIYEVCDSAIPGGNTAGATFSGDTRYVSPNSNCAQPFGSLGIYAFSSLSKDVGAESVWTVPIQAPPGASIDTLTISAGTCGASGMSLIFVYEPGWPTNCAGESQRTFRLGPGSSSADIPIELRCISVCNAGASVYAHYLAAKIIDPVAPQIQAPHGSLFDGPVARGRQSLTAETTDRGGGISEAKVLVNGQPAGAAISPPCNLAQATNPSVVGTVAGSPSPCPISFSPTWTLDTASFPFQDGSNSVQVCASDFASLSAPNSACSAAQTVNVDNSCAESPVGGGKSLTAQFAGSHGKEITVPFDHSAKINGALVNDQGHPITGATICVETQVLGIHRDLLPVATTTTDAHGHFSYKVPAGPNRKVSVGYRHDTFQLGQQMRYFAHAKPTVKLSPSQIRAGGTIQIAGKVPGPYAAGCVVLLEASALHSTEWYQFDRATTNRQGRYHSSFRLDATTRTTTFRIRSVTARQSGFPWAVGHSRSALLRVRADP